MSAPPIACSWDSGWFTSHTLRLEQDTLVYEQHAPFGSQRRLIPLADLDPHRSATSTSYVLTSLAEKRPLLTIQKTPVTSLAIQALQRHLAAKALPSAQEQAALATELKRLEALRRSGTLTEKEYAAAKQRLLTQRTQSGFRGVT